MTRIMVNRPDNYSRAELERIYAYLDHLHDIASEGHVRELTNMSPADLVEYLHELGFTVDETIREIEMHEANLNAVSGREEPDKEKEVP